MAAIATVIALLPTGTAWAQTTSPDVSSAGADSAPTGGVAEVTVTATRRSTSLKDTPIAVSVTTGADLQKYQITSFQDLTQLEPGLVVNNEGISGNQYIIRGILSDIGSTTGFYLDDVPLLGGQAVQENGDGKPGLRLHDLDRVEVLEGPQGTLFGTGSMAGTLRIITNKPKLDRFESGLSASEGGVDGGNRANSDDGYANIPLGPTVAVRAVAWGEFGGGYIDHQITNVAGTQSHTNDNVNDSTVWGGRISLLFQPTSAFSVLLSTTHQHDSTDDTQSWALNAHPYLSTQPTVQPYRDSYDLDSATAAYDAGFGTFTAIGSYGNQHVFHPEDSTAVSQGLSRKFGLTPDKTVFTNFEGFNDYTGEVRFASKFKGPLQLVTGAYYERDSTHGTATAVRADDATGLAACYDIAGCTSLGLRNAGFTTPVMPASNLKNTSLANEMVKQWAVYAQADYKIFDQLTATAGIRYYSASIYDFGEAVENITDWARGVISTPAVTRNQGTDESSPSYNFSLLYKATADLSVYGRVASGFRIGGTNNVANLASQVGVTVPSSYAPDKVWSYELGAKTYLANHRLFLDGDIYQMDWTGQQLSATDPTGAFSYVLNAGQTRIRGAEFKATYTTNFGLSFGGGVTYTDARLMNTLNSQVAAAGTIGMKGDRLPRVPQWTFAGRAEYDYALANDRTLYIQSNLNYRGSSFYSFDSLNAFDQKLPSYYLLGLNAGYRTGPFDFSVFVQNVGDQVAIFGLDAGTHGLKAYSATPRTIGVRGQMHF